MAIIQKQAIDWGASELQGRWGTISDPAEGYVRSGIGQ